MTADGRPTTVETPGLRSAVDRRPSVTYTGK